MPRRDWWAAGRRATPGFPGSSDGSSQLHRAEATPYGRQHQAAEFQQDMSDGTAATESIAVGLLTPTGHDSAITARIVEKAGIGTVICAGMDEVCRLIESGEIGVLMLAEEGLNREGRRCLLQALD